MPLTLYEITIPVFIKELNILSKLLQKGVEHARDKGNEVSEEGLVDARLIGDMKGLGFQSMFLFSFPSFSPSSIFSIFVVAGTVVLWGLVRCGMMFTPRAVTDGRKLTQKQK